MSDKVMAALDGLGDMHVALESVPLPGAWIQRGRCRTVPASVFFPGRGDDVDQARAICARCPVLDECREYAVPHRDLHGVWGGTTGRDRRQLRKHRAEIDARPVEPPRASQAEAGMLERLLEQLTAHPGRWAKVAHFAGRGSAQTTASLLRTGRRAVPPGRWQFVGRRSDAGGSDLYALFEGAIESEEVA